MNDSRPADARREEAPAGSSPSVPHTVDGSLRWELRGRLHAALQELDERPVSWDVVQTLLEGAVESIDAAT